jgi:hypothetical protein
MMKLAGAIEQQPLSTPVPTILLCVNIETRFAGLKVGHLHKSTTLQILMYVPLNLLKIAIGAWRSCPMAQMCWLEPKSQENSFGCNLELFVLILGCWHFGAGGC